MQDETRRTGCAAGLRTALIGAGIGFAAGFFPFAALAAFAQREAAGWLLFGALMVGVGSACVGGILGFITGTIVGTRAALVAAGTWGLPAALVGAVIGFSAGCLATGLAQRNWAPFTEASEVSAFWGSVLGFLIGTLNGTWQAARRRSKRSRLGK